MKRRSRLVPVHVSGSDIGCCVPAPGVGDVVRWFLKFHNPAELGVVSVEEGLLSKVWRVERCGGGTLITDGVIEAELGSYLAQVPAPGEAELTGFLFTDVHGGALEGLAPTRGRVRRVRVTTQILEWQRDGQGELLSWVTGTSWSYDVTRSPSMFVTLHPDEATPRRRSETGVIVDLEVDLCTRR